MGMPARFARDYKFNHLAFRMKSVDVAVDWRYDVNAGITLYRIKYRVLDPVEQVVRTLAGKGLDDIEEFSTDKFEDFFARAEQLYRERSK